VSPADIIHTKNSADKIKPKRKDEPVIYSIIRGTINVLMPSPIDEIDEDKSKA
jgi:hypothetical protein